MGTWTERVHCNRAVLRGLIVLFFHTAAAQFAKSSYFMDSTSDCYNAGYLLIGADGVVTVSSRTPDSAASDISHCTIRFRPQDTRHIIDVSFTRFSISDSGVTLRVDVTGGGTHTLTAGDSKPPKLASQGGMVTLSLTRIAQDAKNYDFAIVVRVYKKDDGMPDVDDSPGPVGLVVGLIVGIIAFLIFIAILGVCCYRRKKEQYLAHRHGHNFQGHAADETLSPSHSYGIDNTAQKYGFPPQRDLEADDDYGNYSPQLKEKLLNPPLRDFDYRDRSESESDAKDPYVIGNYDSSPRKTAGVQYEDENSGRYMPERTRPREYSYSEESSCPKRPQLSGSPKLHSQHANPRYTPETPNMKADRSDDSESDLSTKERLNKTTESVGEERQPPEKTPRKLKPLPPVSQSPKSTVREEYTPKAIQTQQQNTPQRSAKSLSQNSSRNSQPYPASSSSSETEQGKDQDGDDTYAEEKSPLPFPQEKPDTRHTLRPDRAQKKKTPEKPKVSPESIKRGVVDSSDSKPPKSSKEKSKPKKSEKKTGSKQDTPEYEGRFKKADSARKSKSKPPRIGRSRSTGNALDDTDSIGRGSVSSAGGYRAVPPVTADDYEDSDVESNYNPLRKSSSRTSLYASRSSLYGRRRRKNSLGESVYSLANDDADYFDRGSVRERSLSRRHRGFRSVGDLEMELRDQATRSTQTLRETASQTRPRKNSLSSTSGRSKSRDRKNSTASSTGRPKRAKSESELRRKAREAEEDREPRPSGTAREKPAVKPKPRPKPKPRKSTTTMDDDEDQSSVNAGPSEGPGLPAAEGAQVVHPVMPVYAPQGYPGYMVGYSPGMPYIQATGQPPVMVPYGMVPGGGVANPGAAVPNAGAGALNPGAAVSSSTPSGPPTAPKPSTAKWEMLCRITDAAKERDGESVAGSVFSN